MLLIISILYSCSVFKKKDIEVYTKSSYITYTPLELPILKSNRTEEDGMIFIEEAMLTHEPVLLSEPIHLLVSPKASGKKENLIDINNKIDTSLVKYDDIGIIAYNVPKKFKVNEYSTIKLRISKSDDAIAIVGGNRGISIIGKNSKDKVILESIKIDDIMTAILYSDNDSAIIELVNKNETQNIHKNGYTEWIWRIKPLNDKPNYLKLIISISGRDIVVYEKLIPVDGNLWFESVSWIEKWWEVLATTLIIPIVIPIFIYYKRKSNKERS
jgi:hypothetical protein